VRAITKRREPLSLTAHRQTAHCDYDNYAGKDELRDALVSEQRGLCCYCMGRIRPETDSMKIEHWQCRARFPQYQLVYRNLLGACVGGDGQPRHLQHCDTRKGDADLLWNPAQSTHMIEARIRYGLDGSISSDDATFNTQLNDVLNLNLPKIRNNRKGVLDGVLQWLKAEKGRLQGPIPRERLRREIDRRTATDKELAPYCQVAAWWLQKRLARLS
jgi:uncharacterized protein (TIGR02646 family)